LTRPDANFSLPVMRILRFIALSLLGNFSALADKRPNILLIFADDIGYEALNSYGGLDFKTPSLNKMAKQGLSFSRAYTSPACTPSRVSLHTGTYVTRHGHQGILPVLQLVQLRSHASLTDLVTTDKRQHGRR
jgi:hypothetical protein